MAHLRRSLVSLAICACLMGCGSSQVTSEPEPSQRSASGIQTVHSSPPIPCNGIKGIEQVQGLVDGGEGVALISAVITDEPGPVEYGSRSVPIRSYTLLAGALPVGTVEDVQESAADDESNGLPPNSYLLLLGAGDQTSGYFLSDGLPGSFVTEGQHAYEQCPNYADPEHWTVVRTGVTDIRELADLFDTVLQGASGG